MTSIDDAVAVAGAVRTGQRSAREVVDASLAAIERHNPALNAFVYVDPDGARRTAGEIDQAIARGDDPGPLAGVPFGVKDLEDCAGMPTSYGSLLFKGRPPAEEDSIHVARLRAAGAIPLGKTATPEFGMDSATSTKAWGVTRNPWRLDSTPGGSSGGSAAGVAAGIMPLATASDGGGSVRSPAAFCGLIGLKPSSGRIPKARASISALSCPASLVRTVRDCARHLDVASGPDARDRTALPRSPTRYEQSITNLEVVGVRAAWSPDLGFSPVEPGVLALADDAAKELGEAAGLKWTDVESLTLPEVPEVWMENISIDIWSVFEPGMWPDRADELCDLTRSFFEEFVSPSSEQLIAAHQRREAVQLKTAEIFSKVDVVLTPALALSGFKAEGPFPTEINDVPTPRGPEMMAMWANLIGHPAISVPAGVGEDGLPVGLQIVGPQHGEDILLRLAAILERARPWPHLPPAEITPH